MSDQIITVAEWGALCVFAIGLIGFVSQLPATPYLHCGYAVFLVLPGGHADRE